MEARTSSCAFFKYSGEGVWAPAPRHGAAARPRPQRITASIRRDRIILDSSWQAVPLRDVETGVLLGEVDDASSIHEDVLDLGHERARQWSDPRRRVPGNQVGHLGDVVRIAE